MIEKHFFRDELIKSSEFNFSFCMPGSTNNTEFIYELPRFSDEQIEDMIENPYETVSDSYFFLDGKLIVHNKAAYNYSEFAGAEDF